MNNYCTNCGKKLEEDEFACKNCNTPIIDLPYNYEYVSPKKKKQKKIILIIIGIIFLCVIAIFETKTIIHKNKIKKMQEKYAEPYLKENYSDLNYSIEYKYSGKCIISGNCYFDPLMGCDGGSYCNEYQYLDENECKSHYYFIESETKDFTLTVVERNNHFSVVEGKNIYGKDSKNNEDNEDIISNDINDSQDITNTYESGEVNE